MPTGASGRFVRPRSARLADAYAKAVARGSTRPVQDVATRFRKPVAWMRTRVQRARTLGYLERGTQGHAGGRLTAKARRLLNTTLKAKKEEGR